MSDAPLFAPKLFVRQLLQASWDDRADQPRGEEQPQPLPSLKLSLNGLLFDRVWLQGYVRTRFPKTGSLLLSDEPPSSPAGAPTPPPAVRVNCPKGSRELVEALQVGDYVSLVGDVRMPAAKQGTAVATAAAAAGTAGATCVRLHKVRCLGREPECAHIAEQWHQELAFIQAAFYPPPFAAANGGRPPAASPPNATCAQAAGAHRSSSSPVAMVE